MHLIHDEEDLVLACPYCDRSGQLRLRKESSENTKGDGEVRCYECKETFPRDDVVERESRASRMPIGGRDPIGGDVLEQADPETPVNELQGASD